MGNGQLKEAAEGTYNGSIIKMQAIISARLDAIADEFYEMAGRIEALEEQLKQLAEDDKECCKNDKPKSKKKSKSEDV